MYMYQLFGYLILILILCKLDKLNEIWKHFWNYRKWWMFPQSLWGYVTFQYEIFTQLIKQISIQFRRLFIYVFVLLTKLLQNHFYTQLLIGLYFNK